jgi:prepilin-type N-terminal cleavage/methylation domain-containing protein/prepilin-type processing-associated H-X9-DG protein
MKHIKRASAFTLVELLVVIGIIAVLIAILLPVLSKARKAAITVNCASNMRQAGIALTLYQHDNKGFLPLPLTYVAPSTLVWPYAVGRYIGGIRPYERIHCPAIDLEVNGGSTLTFGLNVVLVNFNFTEYKKTDNLKDTSEIILVADSIMRVPANGINPWSGSYDLMPKDGFPYTAYVWNGIADYRHSNKANVLYLDRHVALGILPPNDAASLGNQHAWKGKR